MPITGKQRAQKIDPRYHARKDPWIVRKRRLGWIGLLIGLVSSGWLLSPRGSSHVSTGALSRVHQPWNEQGCEECHTSQVPIRSDAWRGEHPEFVALNNMACSKCHPVGGHKNDSTRKEVLASEACNQCHREHLGLNQDLSDVADNQCARCHSNIASVLERASGSEPNVSSFSTQHPAFRFEMKPGDPGTIKFSHTQHLRPGQPKTPGDATAKKREHLPTKDQDRYQVDPDSQLVTLNCADCHEPDSTSADGAAALDHKTFRPVNFESHCSACHGLDGIPHGLNRALTEKAIADQLPVELFKFFQQRGDTSQLDPQEIQEKEMRLKALLSSKTEGCAKCHQLALPADPATDSIVEPSNVRKRWLLDGTFVHGAHRMVDCKSCHAAAYRETGSTVDSEREADTIMIAGIENCRECHIQDAKKRMERASSQTHVASANCIDCHRYHIDPVSSLPTAGTLQ